MKITNKRLGIKALGVVVLVVYLSFSLVSAQFDLMTKKQQLASLKEQEKRLILENQDTERMLENEDETAYIERIARDRLGYANPDEKVFIDIQGD